MKQKNAVQKKAALSGKKTGATRQTTKVSLIIYAKPAEQPAVNLLPAIVDPQGELHSGSPSGEAFTPIWVPLDLIDVSPLNYRKYYNATALEEFAEGLKMQGII